MFEDFIKKSIDPHSSHIKKALDFGCGPGSVLASLLKKKEFDVDVYDPYFSPEKTYTPKTLQVLAKMVGLQVLLLDHKNICVLQK